jgi:hypothetical protein
LVAQDGEIELNLDEVEPADARLDRQYESGISETVNQREELFHRIATGNLGREDTLAQATQDPHDNPSHGWLERQEIQNHDGSERRPYRRGLWLKHEDQWLVHLLARHGLHNWVRISQEIGSRSPEQCRERCEHWRKIGEEGADVTDRTLGDYDYDKVKAEALTELNNDMDDVAGELIETHGNAMKDEAGEDAMGNMDVAASGSNKPPRNVINTDSDEPQLSSMTRPQHNSTDGNKVQPRKSEYFQASSSSDATMEPDYQNAINMSAQDKAEKEQEESAPAEVHHKHEWVKVTYTPSVVFNTPLPNVHNSRRGDRPATEQAGDIASETANLVFGAHTLPRTPPIPSNNVPMLPAVSMPHVPSAVSNGPDVVRGVSMYDVPTIPSEKSLQEVQWKHVHYGQRLFHARSESGSSYSYANSVLSTTSLASSATDLSKHCGYSGIQITRATRELNVVLGEDADLSLLYKHAIADTMIGPVKLERNLRRIFRNYADVLGSAAGDTLELLASRLVKAKARAAAQFIVQKHNPNPVSASMVNGKQGDESDEEEDAYPVDEDLFEDLISFREFLVGGEPFVALRTQIRSFVLPKSARQRPLANTAIDNKAREGSLEIGTSTLNDDMSMVRESASSLNINEEHMKVISASYRWAVTILKEFVCSACISLRYLEHPLREGATRLRWQCVSVGTQAFYLTGS